MKQNYSKLPCHRLQHHRCSYATCRIYHGTERWCHRSRWETRRWRLAYTEIGTLPLRHISNPTKETTNWSVSISSFYCLDLHLGVNSTIAPKVEAHPSERAPRERETREKSEWTRFEVGLAPLHFFNLDFLFSLVVFVRYLGNRI